MTNYFIAAPSGTSSVGYLVTDGQAFAAQSGTSTAYRLPEGSYKLGGAESTNRGSDPTMIPRGKQSAKKWRLAGVGPLDGGRYKNGRPRVWDKNLGRGRDGLLVHYDGSTGNADDGNGTLGCIGYKDPAAEGVFNRAVSGGDRDLKVVYVKDLKEAKAMAEKLAKGPVPNYGGKVSHTASGNEVAEGEKSVLVGKNKRRAAHRDARHSGGGKIRTGSRNTFIGFLKRLFGRVDDETTDGTKLKTGEQTVEVGDTKTQSKKATARELGNGDSGQDVARVQAQLNRKMGAGLAADGDFGPLTDQAVKAFQTSRGLTADGIVGADTYRALFGG